MSEKWRKRVFSDLTLLIIFITVVFLIPEYTSIPIGCIYNKTTGLYCSGCGLSRGVHALLRGNVPAAANQNILIVTVFPLSAIWLLMRSLKFRPFFKIKRYDNYIILFFIVSVLIFTVSRNIPLSCFDFLRPR